MAKKGFMDGYKTYDTSKGFGTAEDWQQNLYDRMTSEQAHKVVNQQKQRPYEILGVHKHASGREIREAFYRLIKIWHPDKNPDRLEQAEEMSKKIIAAFKVMTDPNNN